MSLSRKGARRVVVDGQAYRWRFGSSGKYLGRLVIQSETGRGRQLVIADMPRTDFWLGFGNTDASDIAARDNLSFVSVTMVGNVVRQAMHLGWEPSHDGPAIYCSWSGAFDLSGQYKWKIALKGQNSDLA
jgi:hypothetical protein